MLVLRATLLEMFLNVFVKVVRTMQQENVLLTCYLVVWVNFTIKLNELRI